MEHVVCVAASVFCLVGCDKGPTVGVERHGTR